MNLNEFACNKLIKIDITSWKTYQASLPMTQAVLVNQMGTTGNLAIPIQAVQAVVCLIEK